MDERDGCYKKWFQPACNKPLVLTAVLFFGDTFHNITGVDESCQLKQNGTILEIQKKWLKLSPMVYFCKKKKFLDFVD